MTKRGRETREPGGSRRREKNSQRKGQREGEGGVVDVMKNFMGLDWREDMSKKLIG